MNNTNYDRDNLAHGIMEMLIEEGFVLTQQIEEHLYRHLALVRKWNDYASLVSTKDLPKLVQAHLVDSLSLAPIVLRLDKTNGALLDIGTGGGFPAIPLKVMFPGLDVLMIERSEKKAAFLRKAVVTLALEKTSVIHGSFPDAVPVCQPDLITARAIDAPERLLAQVLALLPDSGVFLCQIPRAKLDVPATFHVERIHDTWTERQLRRGDLHLISHA